MLIDIAYEDELSGSVLRRLLQEYCPGCVIGAAHSHNGFGYLKRLAPGLNASTGLNILMLTDLDQEACPPALIHSWLKGRPVRKGFCFRVAVREVEAWLLADPDSLQRFLHVRAPLDLRELEQLPDPKSELLRYAKRSTKRAIREAVVRVDKSGNLWSGPDYNGTLSRHVDSTWAPKRAAERALSLRRMIRALRQFA